MGYEKHVTKGWFTHAITILKKKIFFIEAPQFHHSTHFLNVGDHYHNISTLLRQPNLDKSQAIFTFLAQVINFFGFNHHHPLKKN
jgi:hypothetical protein